jgi:glycosyltransferase involved in cell wall biosynthesis
MTYDINHKPPSGKPRIFVLITHYLPGYKSGGPLRTVSSMVHHLGDDFGFYIMTRDRDVDDEQSYPNITVNSWQTVGKAEVRYIPPNLWNLRGFLRLIRDVDCNLVYLNSLFAHVSVYFLFLRRLGIIQRVPVVLAPRGETNPGALALKTFKKRTYIAVSKLLGFYNGVLWQASSPSEKEAILNVFPNASVHVAPNLAISATLSDHNEERRKETGSATIVYISRISRIKNLDFALSCLSRMKHPITFDIYGPISDGDYWKKCQDIIRQLPSNIRVNYYGTIANENVAHTMSKYHAFFLPTGGENFGHAILEALSAGCLVLISDKTPWRHLESKKIGWDLALDNVKAFEQALNQLIEMDDPEFQSRSRATQAFIEKYFADEGILEANRQLFLQAIE